MKLIPLTNGKEAMVDGEVFDFINQWKWHYAKPTKKHGTNSHGYAVRCEKIAGTRKVRHFKMHRVILGATKGQRVDHKNGNGLDNRVENLRMVTASQNRMNCKKHSGSSSVYKGVYRRKDRWVAAITVAGKRRYLGAFKCELDAALMYDAAAQVFYGSFARPNFPYQSLR